MLVKVVTITEEILSQAREKAAELGQLRNSITEGDGNLAAFVGEICAQQVIGGEIKNTFEFDILGKDGITWDVKTKRRTVKPRLAYFCSVADFNTTQRCDRYLFVSLLNFEKAYVLGWTPKEDFYEQAKFYKKGEVDPTSPPGKIFRFTADCYNLETGKLMEV